MLKKTIIKMEYRRNYGNRYGCIRKEVEGFELIDELKAECGLDGGL